MSKIGLPGNVVTLTHLLCSRFTTYESTMYVKIYSKPWLFLKKYISKSPKHNIEKKISFFSVALLLSIVIVHDLQF